MENLSPGSKALYELLMIESTEEYERRFLEYKKEMLDSMRPFVTDTTSKLKAVTASVESVRSSLSSEMDLTKAQIGDELDAVRESLSEEIAHRTTAVGRLTRPDTSAMVGGPSASLHRDAPISLHVLTSTAAPKPSATACDDDAVEFASSTTEEQIDPLQESLTEHLAAALRTSWQELGCAVDGGDVDLRSSGHTGVAAPMVTGISLSLVPPTTSLTTALVCNTCELKSTATPTAVSKFMAPMVSNTDHGDVSFDFTTPTSTTCSDMLLAVSVPAEATLNNWVFRFSVLGLRPLPWPSFECIQTKPCSAIQGKSENLLTGTSFSEENQLQVLAALGTFGCELFSIIKIWNCLQYEYLQQWRPADPVNLLAYMGDQLFFRFKDCWSDMHCAATEKNLILLSAAASHPDKASPKSMQLQVSIQGHAMKFLLDSSSSTCFLLESYEFAHSVGKQMLDMEGPWECVVFLQPKPPWSPLAPTTPTSELVSDKWTVPEYLHISGLSLELDMFGFAVWCMFSEKFRLEAYFPLPSVDQGMLRRYSTLYASNSCGMSLLHDGFSQAWIISSPIGHIIQYSSERKRQIQEYNGLTWQCCSYKRIFPENAAHYVSASFIWSIARSLVEPFGAHPNFGGSRSLIKQLTVKPMELQSIKILWYLVLPVKPPNNYDKCNLPLWEMQSIILAASPTLAVVKFSCRLIVKWPGVLICTRASFYSTLHNAKKFVGADICSPNCPSSTNLQNPSCWNGWHSLMLLIYWLHVPFLQLFWALLCAVQEYVCSSSSVFLDILNGGAEVQHKFTCARVLTVAVCEECISHLTLRVEVKLYLLNCAPTYRFNCFQWEIAWFLVRPSSVRSDFEGSANVTIRFWLHFKLGVLPLLHYRNMSLLRYPCVDQWLLKSGHVIQSRLELIQLRIAWSINLEYFGVRNHSRHLIPTATLTYLILHGMRLNLSLEYYYLAYHASHMPWDPGDYSASAWRQRNPGRMDDTCDPGGSTHHRLEVKPNFIEGGLSATTLPGWSVGRHSWAVTCSRARRGGDREEYIPGRQLRETWLGLGRTGRRLRPRPGLA